MFSRGYKEVADPLYSTIQIPEEIVPIVDHPLVQRLRRVRQLQTVHRVYPSATHTRFEHSLGVMHLAGVFAEELVENGLNEDKEYAKKLAMIAGLLHDVGHGPFSHTFDDVIRKSLKDGWNHERFGHALILNTDLADVISEAGVDPKEVVDLLESRKGALSHTVVYRIYPSDILDFVNRDRLHTNVDVASVKRERLIRNSFIEGDTIVLRSKALDTLRTLLISRRDLFTKVYLHKTSLILDYMIRKILSALFHKYAPVLENALEGDYSEFLRLTDDNVIRDAYNDASIRHIALDVIKRKLPFKCIYRAEISHGPVGLRVNVVKSGIVQAIKDVLKRYKIEDPYIVVQHIKNIPDNPFDERAVIPLDTGEIDYMEVLPDKSLNTIYVRVYVPRDKDIDRDEIARVIRRALEHGEEKIGITMRAFL